ncbi:BLUF domain-containing protein [Methylobacterium sp. A54F]
MSTRAKRTSLVHLIYFSRLNLSSDAQLRAGQIGDITRQAQKKNEFSVITSFLIIEGNFAIQVIEGERVSVHETFNRIAEDQRHRDVQICEWREIAKREFVHSFKTGLRTTATEPLFAKANLLPMLQRGTPRASALHALAVGLQTDAMTKQGIDHLFI